MTEKKLTLALMDPPYESANSTTALRIISAALQKGIHVNVFAYEGAVCLPLQDQAPHANPVKGTTVEEEEHPTTRALISSLLELGKENPLLTWVNCGLCVDERGAGNVVEGVKRGSPADFLKMALESTNTLVIPTK
jgi:sulfur relay (sulfurtransferase) complex TusBCD TusD component (DsrE family)